MIVGLLHSNVLMSQLDVKNIGIIATIILLTATLVKEFIGLDEKRKESFLIVVIVSLSITFLFIVINTISDMM